MDSLDGSMSASQPEPARRLGGDGGSEDHNQHAPAQDRSTPTSDSKRGASQATRLVELVESTDLFVSEDGRPYARVPSGGHYETWSMNSRGFRNWLARRFFQSERKVPGSQSLTDAISVLAGKAQFEGPSLRIHTRLGMFAGRIYLDLGNDAWEAVEVTPEGWSVVARSPVKFRRRLFSPKLGPLGLSNSG